MMNHRLVRTGIAAYAALAASVVYLEATNPQWWHVATFELKNPGNAHECNICGRTFGAWFMSSDHQPEALCPFCYSRARHRTAYRWLLEHSDLFDGRPKRMLHVAPESYLQPIFQAIPNLDYLSADLDPTRAMVRMDITDIQYPDNSFDVIYCSHVLEHVTDDRKAMRELARVLRPGGWGVLAVPITRTDSTFEDPSIVSPAERVRAFGQEDHVRAYGPDFTQRLEESGFDVTVDGVALEWSEDEVDRFGFSREAIYAVRKAAGIEIHPSRPTS